MPEAVSGPVTTAYQPLPQWAAEWMAEYECGVDMTTFFYEPWTARKPELAAPDGPAAAAAPSRWFQLLRRNVLS